MSSDRSRSAGGRGRGRGRRRGDRDAGGEAQEHARAAEPDDAARLIWEIPEPPSRPRREALSRERIAAAAVAIADADGLDAVSMRRVASELGVGTMSVYHYIRSKDDLLDLMGDRVLGEQLVPGELPGGWREALRAISIRTREAMVAHPWTAESFGRARVTPNLLRHIEQTITAVAKPGIPPELAAGLALAADDYTLGYTLREMALRGGRAANPLADPAAAGMVDRLLASGDFPGLAEARRHRASPPDLAADRFEQGLDWLLDGMEAAVERARAERGEPDAV